MAFRFVDGERAARLDALDADPPPPPVGAHVRRGRRRRTWEVVDASGRVLGTWATWAAAERDAERYRRAEAAPAARGEATRP